jgi:hypothetical protein
LSEETPPAASPRTGSHTGLFIGVVSVVALLVVAAIAVGLVFVGSRAVKKSPPAVGPVLASTEVSSTRGKTVFSDDFLDAASGWTTDALPSGTTFKYTPNGYVVVAKGTLDHFAGSPYKTPVQQVAISVTATQSGDAPAGVGYGVSCWRGIDTSELRYDFTVMAGGDWTVDRRDGGILTKPLILKRGRSSATLGSTALAVEGLCATLADQHTIRLILFAGTQRVADITDRATTLADAGWQADLMVTSSAIQDSTVTVAHFEVRDLAR